MRNDQILLMEEIDKEIVYSGKNEESSLFHRFKKSPFVFFWRSWFVSIFLFDKDKKIEKTVRELIIYRFVAL